MLLNNAATGSTRCRKGRSLRLLVCEAKFRKLVCRAQRQRCGVLMQIQLKVDFGFIEIAQRVVAARCFLEPLAKARESLQSIAITSTQKV